MAAKKESVPPYAQAVITICELCERGEARYFCQECQQDICKQCKSIHLRTKSTRNHAIISSAEEVDEEKPVFCTSHPEEQAQMYCYDCNVPVCLTCIADKKHPNHALMKMPDAVEKCRKELLKCISESKQEISELEGTLMIVENAEKEYETQHKDTIGSINKRREELKSQVDKSADDLINEAKEQKNQDTKELKTHSNDITRVISDKRARIESCEEMLQTKRGFPVIQLTSEFKQKLDLGPSRNLTIPVVMAPRFVCSKSIDIQGVFGVLELGSKGNEQATGVNNSHDGQSENTGKTSENKDQSKGTSTTIDTTTVADIKLGFAINCISTVNDKKAWVAHGLGGCDMALIDINGQVKNRGRMDFNIHDIAIISDGDILLTNRGGYSIKKYTKDGCVDSINTSPSNPYGICVTSHNGLLVCLHSSGGSRVVKMTTNGTVKQTIKQDQHKALFTMPQLITENINGDVCVVDNYQTVVVLNKEGVLKFRYPDTGKSSNNIGYCYGIACDRLGFILISDCYKHQIHQVDMDGRFVQYILTKQHGVQNPLGLSIDATGKLWVCNENGYKVSVIKYRS